MNELFKMWLANKLENLEGFEITGKLVLPKKVVSKGIIAPSNTVEESESNDEENSLTSNDFNNAFNHLQIHKLNMKVVRSKVIIDIDVKR